MDCRMTKGAALSPFPSTVITQCDKFHTAVLMKWVEENKKKLQSISHKILIPVAARSKAGLRSSLAGFAGSGPARIMNACLL